MMTWNARRGGAPILGLCTAFTIATCCFPSHAADLPKTEAEKTLYAIGLTVARSLSVFDLSPAELQLVQQGLSDAVTSKTTAVDLQDYNARIQDLARSRRKALGERQAGAGKELLEKAAKEKGAVTTTSGMVYIPVTEGKGESPTDKDIVKVNYRGTLIDGREFESSYRRGKPLEFRLENVIKCWSEGIGKMRPGGKARFVCPPQLAYGDKGIGEMVLPGATLAFEVELLEVKKGGANTTASSPVGTADPPVPAKK